MISFEFLLHLPNALPKNGNFLYIYEGTGDNLYNDDIISGYCDYFMYDTFMFENGKFLEIDGGQVLLQKNYQEYSEKDIFQKAFEMINYNGIEYYIIDKN